MNIGFLGTGNMSSALICAIDRNCEGVCFYLSNPHREKAVAVQEKLRNRSVITDNEETVLSSDMLFVGVKPQKLSEVLIPLREAFTDAPAEQLIVSMVAAKEIATIRELAGTDAPVIRIMPNTPVAVDAGVIGYSTSGVRGETEDAFRTLFSGSALLVRVPEPQLDAISALSGSGPAYTYAFMRALAESGVSLGLDQSAALAMAAETVLGAARLLLASGKSPEALIAEVCSPAGSTIEGMRALDAGGMETSVRAAVAAAYRRSLEMK
ncbi:MAG: pyrroline-5-carboxylate reductase [Lachnospiraceae bacterium]|nr:pyrroline-5-carboxylate reductase [Lachnospiraceae bacterium]